MKKNLIIISICLLCILIITIIATVVINGDQIFSLLGSPSPDPSATSAITPTTAPTSKPTVEPTATPVPIPPYTNIVIGIAGDIIAHEKVLENAYQGKVDGIKTYAFDHMLKYIKPALEYPDLMIVNLESPLAGEEVGYSKNPSLSFNFPDSMAAALKYAGVDLALNGNNHIVDRHVSGLYRTLDTLDSVGLYHTGAWRSPEERAIPTVIDVEGIKVGIVSATYSLNGREAYISKEILNYLVCFIDEAEVKAQIDLCREYGADIVIVSPHMGDEYQPNTREGIRKYGEAYIALGADIVVAHHPHVIQPAEKIQVQLADGTIKEGICFWSLGNFMHNQVTLQTDYAREVRETGIILYINIKKDNNTGEVIIESLEYLPIWMLRRSDLNPRLYAVMPAGNAIDFTSPPYDELPLSNSNFRDLGVAWKLAKGKIDKEIATPLSTIPTKQDAN